MEQWFILFAQIMMINLVLSGDNALVIAMASRSLPQDQVQKAMWWGAFAAIALRIVLTAVAMYLLRIPYVQALGAILLIWVAFKILQENTESKEGVGATTLVGAIWTILVADFVMSFDNVLAIAAKANGDFTVIVIGIVLSIPIIVWGSKLVLLLLQKKLFIYLGAGVLGYTAGEMLLKDVVLREWVSSGSMDWALPLSLAIVVVGYGFIHTAISPKH
jgi:YjbE family integral membrane protein